MSHSLKSSPSHYGKVSVTIHWISALLIFVLLGSGFRSGYTQDTSLKTLALQIHVPVAIIVLILVLVRLVWWWKFDRKPDAIEGVPNWQEIAARWTHKLLYALLIVLLASGIAMSVMSGLPFALFGDASLPTLADLPPRTGHGIAARIVVATITLHAIAAFYHHFFLKDRTLRRMWFQ